MVIPLNARPSAFWKANTSAGKRPVNKRKEGIFIRRSVMAVLAMAALLLVGLGALIASRYPASQGGVSAMASGTLRVPMTVQSGDTLWNLAKRYGDPNVYLLDRVDVLAKANRMSTATVLMPGQRIVIPVSNPVEVARLRLNLAKN